MHNNLIEALQIDDGDVVVFVGAGGKTTTMFALAHELRDAGKRVVVTTTTKIFPPTEKEAACTLLEEDPDLLLTKLEVSLTQYNPLVVATTLGKEGKLVGISPESVRAISRVSGVSNVLVEADGAAQKPFKAPLDYEPVIPEAATVVVPVVGVEVVGQTLTEEHVQRAERLAQLAGRAIGSEVTAVVVAMVMLHPQGNIKGTPKGARIVPLINKVEGRARVMAARDIAEELFIRGADRVVLAHSATKPPVVEVLTRSVDS